MVRIYFDKQIFSHLYKQEKSLYIDLLKKIENHKTSLFCYSHAHLLDLKSDKTDIKYSELSFMERIVNDNYLSYHALDKKTSPYLAKPLEAFQDIEDEPDFNDFSALFNFDTSDLNESEKDIIEQSKLLLDEKLFDLNFLTDHNGDPSTVELLKKIFPDTTQPMNITELLEYFMGMVKTMNEDKTVYKNLRNLTDKHLNNGKFTVDYNEINFNEDLKDSVLQKSFIDFVTDNLNPNGNKEISKYDFFTNAYLNLDILGISKESSKNVKFNNMLNDSLHSYYGAYCDCVVSDDSGFLKKTRALYKLLGIETKVLHAEEFIKSFDFILDKEELDILKFKDLLVNDLKNGLVINERKSIRYNRQSFTIKPIHKYLGFFNRIDKLVEDSNSYLYFYRRTKNYSYFRFLREYEMVVNNAVKIFGVDQDSKGEFDWDKEREEINSDNWEGRFWDFQAFTFKIENNIGSRELSILMSFVL